MSGDRLIPDLANDPPPERDDERPRPERPPPWEPREPEGSRPPPPPPPSIPPPSQPQPFEEAPFPYAAREEAAERKERETTPYASRFQLILGALLGIAAVAIVSALLVGTGPKAKPDPHWSGWKPTTKDRSDASQEIANHVAPSYRLDEGGQLVAVTGGDLKAAADIPARLALADPSNGNISVLNGKGSLYVLCGLGPKCGIDQGTPSPQRHLLLRREALELALYTFRYVKNTDYVVALLPPTKAMKAMKATKTTKATKATKAISNAVFFTRDDLRQQLDLPLTRTLPSPPPTSDGLNPTEISTLESLTDNRMFQFKFEQGQDATVFLVLQPFAG
jgi:hypothetical protein